MCVHVCHHQFITVKKTFRKESRGYQCQRQPHQPNPEATSAGPSPITIITIIITTSTSMSVCAYPPTCYSASPSASAPAAPPAPTACWRGWGAAPPGHRQPQRRSPGSPGTRATGTGPPRRPAPEAQRRRSGPLWPGWGPASWGVTRRSPGRRGGGGPWVTPCVATPCPCRCRCWAPPPVAVAASSHSGHLQLRGHRGPICRARGRPGQVQGFTTR